jgi:hypothetical protein
VLWKRLIDGWGSAGNCGRFCCLGAHPFRLCILFQHPLSCCGILIFSRLQFEYVDQLVDGISGDCEGLHDACNGICQVVGSMDEGIRGC